jgi:microcin C transport system substrate-binding protein
MRLSGPNRREVLAAGGAGAAVWLAETLPLRALTGRELHGLSVFGDLKYPADFTHFDYVDPDAPKGGLMSLVPSSWAFNQNPNTFNTLNTLILRGDAPVGLDIIYDSLMTRAADEPDAVYGLIARSVEIVDEQTYLFRLREEARWHDGTALTAEDVAFSLSVLKDHGHPLVSQAMWAMDSVEAVADHEVVVRFLPERARDLPQFIASLPIVSSAYYAERDFSAATMEPPLGSGPYRVGRVRPGRSIDYERVEDYWARDLPVRRGMFNFDTIRYEFYRDRDVAFEAFKAGEYMLREEFTARVWATGYDFPAVRDGRVVLLELPDDTPSGAQGWFLNTRRSKFADPRVREALIYAFDFEWTNRTLFHGLYERTHSYFQNSELMAEGPPTEAELELLEPYRGQVPDEVFGEPFVPPVSDGTGQDRRLLRQATALLREAGWQIQNGTLRNAQGEQLSIEFLDNSPAFERVVQPYVRNLGRLGIQARYRVVDASQYQQRLNEFDFDVATRRWSMSPTPGEGIRRFWTSASADSPGTNNLSGISDPVIDELTDKVVNAESREAQVVAARALDRVLRAGRYWVPHWYKGSHHVACWDAFGRPPEKPRYSRGILDTWWYDPDKAAQIGRG